MSLSSVAAIAIYTYNELVEKIRLKRHESSGRLEETA
jgi:hypothetical protein